MFLDQLAKAGKLIEQTAKEHNVTYEEAVKILQTELAKKQARKKLVTLETQLAKLDAFMKRQ